MTNKFINWPPESNPWETLALLVSKSLPRIDVSRPWVEPGAVGGEERQPS